MFNTLIGCLVLVCRSANDMHFSADLNFVLLIIILKNSVKEVIQGKPELCSRQVPSSDIRRVLKGTSLDCDRLTWMNSI